jgi:hypothetical protein
LETAKDDDDGAPECCGAKADAVAKREARTVAVFMMLIMIVVVLCVSEKCGLELLRMQWLTRLAVKVIAQKNAAPCLL